MSALRLVVAEVFLVFRHPTENKIVFSHQRGWVAVIPNCCNVMKYLLLNPNTYLMYWTWILHGCLTITTVKKIWRLAFKSFPACYFLYLHFHSEFPNWCQNYEIVCLSYIAYITILISITWLYKVWSCTFYLLFLRAFTFFQGDYVLHKNSSWRSLLWNIIRVWTACSMKWIFFLSLFCYKIETKCGEFTPSLKVCCAVAFFQW